MPTTTPLRGPKLTKATVNVTGLIRGSDYCYSVRALDRAGYASAWSPDRCIAVALDDRSLTASSGWTRSTGSAYLAGTYTSTSLSGKTLTLAGAHLDRVGIVATCSSTSGIVGVYVGTTLIGKINLASAKTRYQVVLLLPLFKFRTGTVTLKSLTSGKPISIDGLILSQT